MAKARRSDLYQNFAPIEAENFALGFQVIAGIDEAGRGPLAGPVVAAAVILPAGFKHGGIRDSKLLTPKHREELAPIIQCNAISWGLGIVDVDEIDRSNILKATLTAMSKACQSLAPAPDLLLIDGNQTIPRELFPFENLSGQAPPRQTAVIKGDQLCLSIAAASIVAKVARDEMMIALDATYPEYGFAKHKGYGSVAHLEALHRHGPSPVHRRSFAPVRRLCEAMEFAQE
ncbi:MAG: ribonuclease HII [Deltaproteobacteria bacterium]|nr:ribonuclease HII [Deltaproteobacteria bacterium]